MSVEDDRAPGGAVLMVALENPPPASAGVTAPVTGKLEKLYRLGYVSTQTRPIGTQEMLSLLQQAREANRECDVTGLLLHRENSFFQVLEGPERAVLEVFEKLKGDPRHQRIELLFQGACDEREFPDWRMGFSELDGIDVSQLPGFSGFLVEDAEPRWLFQELTRTQRLMVLFRTLT